MSRELYARMADLAREGRGFALATVVRTHGSTPQVAGAKLLVTADDARGKTAGTLKPEHLKTSIQDEVLRLSPDEGCWYAFGLSILDGYHSVLLLVDHTGTDPVIYWLDQFATGIDDDVTTTLDERVTTKTQNWWQAVMDSKGVGYKTTARLWQLRKPVGP